MAVEVKSNDVVLRLNESFNQKWNIAEHLLSLSPSKI